MKRFLRSLRRRRVIAHGRELATRYIRAVESISGDLDTAGIAFAETVCPLLKSYRRRAKACAKVAGRLAR